MFRICVALTSNLIKKLWMSPFLRCYDYRRGSAAPVLSRPSCSDHVLYFCCTVALFICCIPLLSCCSSPLLQPYIRYFAPTHFTHTHAHAHALPQIPVSLGPENVTVRKPPSAPFKLYYDMAVEPRGLRAAYGVALDPVFAAVSDAAGRLSPNDPPNVSSFI